LRGDDFVDVDRSDAVDGQHDAEDGDLYAGHPDREERPTPTNHQHLYLTLYTAELLQTRDLACGTLFQPNCVILTSLTDCSDDSRRDTFFGKHEHGAL